MGLKEWKTTHRVCYDVRMYPLAPTEETIQQAIEATKSCSRWVGLDYRQSPQHAIARDAFIKMITQEPASAFERVKDHAFWLHWKSKKSNGKTDALHVAIQNAHDVEWVKVLIEHLKPCKTGYYIQSAQNRFGSSLLEIVKLLEEYDLYQEDEVFFRSLCRNGLFSTIQHLMDKGEFKSPLKHVEQIVLARHNFEKNKTVSHETVLTYLWDKWGTSHVDWPELWQTAWRLHAFSEQKYPLRNATSFLLKHHHPFSPSWTEACEYTFAYQHIVHGEVDALKTVVFEKEWPLTEKVWQRLLLDLRQMGRYRNVVDVEEIEAWYTKTLLEKKLSVSSYSRSASPRKL